MHLAAKGIKAMSRLVIDIRLFFSSFAPLFVLLGLRFEGVGLRIACFGLGALFALDLCLIMWQLRRGSPMKYRMVCAATLADLAERRWRPDDPEAHLTDDECIHVMRDVLRPTPPVLDVLDHAATLDLLSASTLPPKPLLFYAVIVGSAPDRYTAFLRKYNPYLSIKTGRFGFVSALGDRLARIEDPVFAFENRFDLVVTEEDIVVLSTKVYELLFRETEPLTERIPKYIGKIAASLNLDPQAEHDLQTLAAKSPRLQQRLRALSERDYIHRVTIDQVRAYIHKLGMDPERLIRDGQLVLDSTDPQLLLQVLNEDLYTGDLSGTSYAVDRKSARQATDKTTG